jgi:hypothetical protein
MKILAIAVLGLSLAASAHGATLPDAPTAKTEVAAGKAAQESTAYRNPLIDEYLKARHLGVKPAPRTALTTTPGTDPRNTYKPRVIALPIARIQMPIHVTIGKPAPVKSRR